MRHLKYIIPALVAGTLSVPAFAADAIEAPPAPPVSEAPVDYAPAASWSGFYAGGFAGYGWGTFDSSAGNISANGWNAGGFAGGNIQQGNIVYGAEADIGWSGASATTGGVTVDQGVFGSLRARLGYAFDPFMLYGTAGIAATQATVSDAGGSDTNTHLGWTVGVGGEALITNNIFGRVEYRYTDYNSKDFDTGTTAVSSGFSDHSVRTGLGIKF